MFLHACVQVASRRRYELRGVDGSKWDTKNKNDKSFSPHYFAAAGTKNDST